MRALHIASEAVAAVLLVLLLGALALSDLIEAGFGRLGAWLGRRVIGATIASSVRYSRGHANRYPNPLVSRAPGVRRRRGL